MSGMVIQGSFPHGVPVHLKPNAAVPPARARSYDELTRHAHERARGGVAQPYAPGSASSSAFLLPPHLATFGRRAGQKLPQAVLRKMESFFQADLSGVDVHVGPEATAIGALAFTQGSSVYFAPGQYRPDTVAGQRLIAHELTHVLQQRAGRVPQPFRSGVAVVHDPALEAEAERNAAQAASHQPPAATAPPAAVQRHALRADAPEGEIAQMVPRRPQRAAARRQWGDRSMRGRQRYRALTVPLDIVELGQQLLVAYRRVEGNDAPGLAGRNYVYIATSRGQGTYVGISNNPARRQVGHGERFHLHVLNRAHPFRRIEVRGIEQALINAGRGAAANQNIAESISQRHAYYAPAVRFGQAFVAWVINNHGDDLTFQM